MRKIVFVGSVLAVPALLASAARAATNTWNGTGTWVATTGNWSLGTSPGSPTGTGDTLEIATGDVEYAPSEGGDFRLNETLTVNAGAIFHQTAGNGAWLKIGDSSDATLNVYGTFIGLNGVGGNFFAGNGAKGDINVLGGSLSTSADLVVQNGSTVTAQQITTTGVGSTASITAATSTLQVNAGTVISGVGATMQFQGINLNQSSSLLSADGGTISTTNNIGTYNGAVQVKNGGTFTQTNGNLAVNVGSTLTIAGASSTLNLNDTGAGELQPRGGSISVSGGTLNVSLISFNNPDASPCTIELSGGTINIRRGDFFSGIFTVGGERYVDFTGDEKGILFFNNGSFQNTINLITGGTIRINGGVVDWTNFDVYSAGGGIFVQVPEPTSVSAIGLAATLSLRRKRRAVLAR